MMDRVNSTLELARTKSDQLVESMAAAMAAMRSPPSSGDATATDGMLSRKSSRRMTSMGASPGRGQNSNRYHSTHIRKSRSAQLNSHKLDIDEVTSGAALSRASSASLGLSFSFTGFNMPPEDIGDSKPFSDDDIPEDIEAGPRRKRIAAEPTLPIYLKETWIYLIPIYLSEKARGVEDFLATRSGQAESH